MPALHAQHVFRHDRKHAGERVRPERGRAQQDANADAADVRARKIEPFTVEDATEKELGNDSRNDREGSPFVTFEDAVEEMPDEQDERDEERRDVTIVETQTAPGRNVNRVYRLNC